MSKEAYEGDHYNCALNDLYSAGILAFTLITGLYPENTEMPFYMAVKDPTDLSSLWAKVPTPPSKTFKLFLETLLLPNSLRPTLSEVKNHLWLKRKTISHYQYTYKDELQSSESFTIAKAGKLLKKKEKKVVN
jgi:hypothetical protein